METDIKTITKSDGKLYTVRNNRDRIFYPGEWIKFYNALKPMQTFTFDVLISTGARINEARHIKIEDIDINNRRIILRVTKVKATKGEKNPHPRTIPISSQFARRLNKYIKGNNLKNENYIKIKSTSAANTAMKKALQKTGIKDYDMFSVHNVRKTLETWLMSLDVEGLKLMKHMGHTIEVAASSYLGADIYSHKEKLEMRMIIGDLYQ